MKIVVIQEARYVRGCRGKGGPAPITKYPAKVILDGVKMDSELPENQAHADYINSVFNIIVCNMSFFLIYALIQEHLQVKKQKYSFDTDLCCIIFCAKKGSYATAPESSCFACGGLQSESPLAGGLF